MESSKKAKPRSARASAGPPADLTAGDMARMLRVDLTTIHNWVRQGHLFGRRTKGRHLRFARTEVVRFLRRFDYPIPARLGRSMPRVLVNRARSKRAKDSSASQHTQYEGLYEALLEASGGTYEVFFIDLDAHTPAVIDEVVSALRARPSTCSLGLVGISRTPGRRRAFIDSGGDLALASPTDAELIESARYVTGGAASPPPAVVKKSK